MTNLTSVELTQFILIGIGVLSIILAPVAFLISAKPGYRTFDLKSGVEVAKSTREASPTPAALYQPVPVSYAATPRVVRVGNPIGVRNLKETVKIRFSQVLSSSKKLLSAVRRELNPEPPPSPETKMG